MKLSELIQVPPSETYIKNSSRLVSGLFVIGGLLYYPTNGYGTVIALALALIVLVGQKMLLTQANKDFVDMYQAQALFEKMLKDNKVLSDKAKNEIHKLQAFSQHELEKMGE